MAAIKSICTALPAYQYSLNDIREAGKIWLREDRPAYELFSRFVESSKTNNRHFSIPIDNVLNLNGLKNRAEIFEEKAPSLGSEAVTRAIAKAEISPLDLSTFVFTSCSCPSIPAVDALILERTGLSRSVNRIPIYQHGCAGGVVGLSIASKFASGGANVVLSSVELCSLVFQSGNHTGGHLVGAAIFGDGASAAVIGPEDKGLVFVESRSYLLPNTRHLMGYDIFDDGFHLRLDRELPQSLGKAIPELVDNFLKDQGICRDEVAWWLFHPGGVKILGFLEETFSLRPEQCRFARDILSSVGNISSSSILFVMESFLRSGVYRDGDYALVVGVGPGLTVELILLEVRS